MNIATQVAAPAARHVPAGAGRAIDFPLHPISQLVAGADMPSNLSLFDVTIAARSPGAPPHVHSHEDEVYYVLEGEITFQMEDEIVTARAGDTVILPRGGLHATWNESDAPARALTLVSQDTRFEVFFDEVVRTAAERGVNGPAEAAAVVGEIAAEMGVRIDMSRLADRAKPLFGMA